MAAPKTIAIGWDELEKKPSLKEGDLVACTYCGGEHRVVALRSQRGPDVPIASLLRDAPKGWCARLARRTDEDDYTRICLECEPRGCVPGDFPHCGPHQWQPQWLRCLGCGESMHPNAVYATDHPLGQVHYPNGRNGERCGPFEPDPQRPGYWQCSGASMRREIVLLSFQCGDKWFAAGMNGKAIGDANVVRS